MNKLFLLTYIKCDDDGFSFETFDWFSSEKDLRDFIKENDDCIIELCEAQEIIQVKEIKL